MEETFNTFLNIAKPCTLQVCVHCFLARTISQVLLILLWLQDNILLQIYVYYINIIWTLTLACALQDT